MPSTSSALIVYVWQPDGAGCRRAWGYAGVTIRRGSMPKKTASLNRPATPHWAKDGRPRADESTICSREELRGKKVSIACAPWVDVEPLGMPRGRVVSDGKLAK